MKSLYYPAVLGSWLFLYFSKIHEIYSTNSSIHEVLSNLSIWFGLYLILYFSITFWDTYSEDITKYKPLNFFIDLIELAIISSSFYFLGFFAKSGLNANIPFFYLTMLPLPWLHPIWAKLAGYRSIPLPSSVQLFRFIFFLCGFIFFSQSVVFSIIVFFFLFFNIAYLFFEMSNSISFLFFWDRKLFPKRFFIEKNRYGITLIHLPEK